MLFSVSLLLFVISVFQPTASFWLPGPEDELKEMAHVSALTLAQDGQASSRQWPKKALRYTRCL